MKLANAQAGYLPSLGPYSRFALNVILLYEVKAGYRRRKYMRTTKRQIKGKRYQHLRVPVLPEEKTAIEQQAEAAGLSVAAYLRNVGLGYEIHGILDYRCVQDLTRTNGDLGRVGGLLKLWLTNDERFMQFRPIKVRAIILQLLARIESNQNELRTIIKKIIAS